MDRNQKLILVCASLLSLVVGCAEHDGFERDESAAAESADEGEVASTAQALVKHNGFLPHNQARRYRSPNGCEFIMQHGNYLAAAYAKADILTPGCQGIVRVTASSNGQLVGANSPYLFETGGFEQAQVNYANIIGSDLHVINVHSGTGDTMQFAGL